MAFKKRVGTLTVLAMLLSLGDVSAVGNYNTNSYSVRPIENSLMNIGVRESIYELKGCEAEYEGWMFAIRCEDDLLNFDSSFFENKLRVGGLDQNTIIAFDIQTLIDSQRMAPYYFVTNYDSKSKDHGSLAVSGYNYRSGATSQSVNFVSKEEIGNRDAGQHLFSMSLNLGNFFEEADDYKAKNLKRVERQDSFSGYFEESGDSNSGDFTLVEAFTDEFTQVRVMDRGSNDQFIQVLYRQGLETGKVEDSEEWVQSFTVDSLSFDMSNSWRFKIIQRDVKAGDRSFASGATLLSSKFYLGRQYNMVAIDTNSADNGLNEFLVYEWQVLLPSSENDLELGGVFPNPDMDIR
mmetsp:Transcript_11274/g.18978  ORF Transcript_11274/g.18978 Transcript_11274/m.18978 type:complete len:350 (+) Transcript_11274:22-1071(+)